MKNFHIILALLIVGLAVGIPIGKWLNRPEPKADEPSLPSPGLHLPQPSAARIGPPAARPPITNQVAVEAALNELLERIDRHEAGPVIQDQFVDRVTPEMLPVAFDLGVKTNSGLTVLALNRLAGRWASLDPAAAAIAVEAVGERALHDGLIHAVAEKWLDRDVEAALRWVEQGKSPGVERLVYPKLVHRLTARDPARAAELAQRLAGPIERQLAYQSIMPRWIQYDPAAACRKLVEGFAPEHGNQNYLYDSISAWSAKDPLQAIDWLRSAPDTKTRRAAISWLGQIVAGSYPTNILKLIATIPLEDTVERDSAMTSLGQGWVLRDPAAALAWAQSLSKDERRDMVIQHVLIHMQQSDVDRVRAFIANDPEHPAIRGIVEPVMKSWAEQNPTQALAWAVLLAPVGTRTNAIQALLNTWVTTAPGEAIAAADRVLEGEPRRNAVVRLLERWSYQDVRAAARFCVEQRLNVDGTQAYTVIATTLFSRSSTNATEWLLQLPASSARVEAGRRVIGLLLRNNPVAAATFVEQLPEPDALASVVWLLREWMLFNRNAAMGWMDHLPEGSLKSKANEVWIQLMAETGRKIQ